MQLLVLPEMAFSSRLISLDLDELRRSSKWISVPVDAERGTAFKNCMTILERFKSLCTAGSVAYLGPHEIEVDDARLNDFQQLFANLNADEILLHFCHMSLEPPAALPAGGLQILFNQQDLDNSGELDQAAVLTVATELLQKLGLGEAELHEQLSQLDLSFAGFPSETWKYENFYNWFVEAFSQFGVEQLKQLINSICHFFCNFCHNCPSNQQRLYKHIPFFQKLVVQYSGLHAVYPLIAAIIRDQPRFCTSFDKQWLHSEVNRQSKPFDIQFIRLLRSLASSRDTQIVNMVLHIVELDHKALWLCSTQEECKLRAELILGSAPAKDGGPTLEHHLESLHLLMDCLKTPNCNSNAVRIAASYKSLTGNMVGTTLPKVSVHCTFRVLHCVVVPLAALSRLESHSHKPTQRKPQNRQQKLLKRSTLY